MDNNQNQNNPPLTNNPYSMPLEAQLTALPPTKKSKKPLIITVICIFIVLVIVGLIIFFIINNTKKVQIKSLSCSSSRGSISLYYNNKTIVDYKVDNMTYDLEGQRALVEGAGGIDGYIEEFANWHKKITGVDCIKTE